jgi:hypothetical protein
MPITSSNNARTSVIITHLLDVFTVMQSPLAHPRASRRPTFPTLRRVDIGTPERPGPTLSGAVWVDGTADFFIKEDTILVLFLNEADILLSHNARVTLPEISLRDAETLGEHRYLHSSHEYGAGKTAATPPASQTHKAQPVFIPEIITHAIIIPLL